MCPLPRLGNVRPCKLVAFGLRRHSLLRKLRAGLMAALIASPSSPLLGVAAAQTSPPPSPASAVRREQQATELFRQARDLLDQGNRDKACALFARVLELKMSPGVLLNLGNCYEWEGDLLRSVSTFERALVEAQAERDAEKRKKWIEAAKLRRAAVLELVPSLTVRVSPPVDVRLMLDGQELDPLRGPVQLNPGRHRVEAIAKGKQPYLHEFELETEQDLELEVPLLDEPPQDALLVEPSDEIAEPAAIAKPKPTPIAEPEPALVPDTESVPIPFGKLAPISADVEPEKSTLPWVLLGTGAGVGAFGFVAALMAKSKENQLDESCNAPVGGTRYCDDPALESVKRSGENWQLTSYVAWGVAAVSLGVGVTLFAVGEEDSGRTTLSAGCFGEACGLSAVGKF